MALEQGLRVPGQFENPQTLIHVGLLGLLMPLDVPETAALFISPLASHPVEEIAGNLSVQLVDIHRVDPRLEPIILSAQPANRLLMLTALVRLAGVQCLAQPLQHLVIKAKPVEHGGELLLQHLLAHILPTARGRLAPTFVRVAGAVIVDVFLLLDLADHRTAASRASDQAGEGEVMRHAAVLARIASVHGALHPLPQFDGHQRLVLSLIELAVPLEPAGVETVAQDRMHGAGRHRRAALLVNEPSDAGLLGNLLQRVFAGGIPLEELGDDRRDLRIDGDHLSSVRAGDVQVAERCLGRPDALLGLLLHSLAGFFRQVVDVVLRHQHLDAVHELLGRARVARQDHPFLRKVDLGIQFVDRHPILQVAIEPVGLLDQDHPHVRMRPQPGHHLAEGAAARLLGGLDVDILLRHGEAFSGGIVLEQLQLRWDRVALLLLLLRGNAGIDHCARAGRRGGWLGGERSGGHFV